MRKIYLIIFTFFITSLCLFSQERHNYSIHEINGVWDPVANPASSYWFGNTYTFTIAHDVDGFDFIISWVEIKNGKFENVAYNAYDYFYNYRYNYQVSSCVYDKDLYAFVSTNDGTSTSIQPYVRKIGHDWVKQSSIAFPQNITTQFSTVTYNDTIFMFFVDDSDSYVKFHKLIKDQNSGDLQIVTTDPLVLNEDFKAIESVTAITFVDNDLKEKIMVVYAGEKTRFNNKINIYTSTSNNNFELYFQLDSYSGYHADNVVIAQGSAYGGYTGTYNVQIGYTFANNNSGVTHCELDMRNKGFSDWELLDINDIFLLGKYGWFMECYSKETHSRDKYILLGCTTFGGSRGFMWKSDKLIYQDSKDTIPPFSLGKDVVDVVLVSEGAPPYALNGYTLSNGIFNGNPPSNFLFSTSSTHSVSTETTYSLGIEANMGFGPVTAGFKSSFMESSGSSNTETITLSQNIEPSTYDSDSAGHMWYFYVAPSIVRHRWECFDYDGNTIDGSKRNLFFFELKSPSMLVEKIPLTEFGDYSPREYDLESYCGREVINFSGLENLYNKAVTLDFSGTFPDLSIELDKETTKSNSQDYEVSVGVEFESPILDISGGLSASLRYSRESTTICEKSETFEASWYDFRPPSLHPESQSNVRSFSPEMYFMKTTDNTAYFLLDNINVFRPFFITYEVGQIVYGNLSDPPYYIGENKELTEKYKVFNYPNPCKLETNISFVLNTPQNTNLTVVDIYGKPVFNTDYSNLLSGKNEITIPVSRKPAGLYFYKLTIDKDIIIGRFVVTQ